MLTNVLLAHRMRKVFEGGAATCAEGVLALSPRRCLLFVAKCRSSRGRHVENCPRAPSSLAIEAGACTCEVKHSNWCTCLPSPNAQQLTPRTADIDVAQQRSAAKYQDKRQDMHSLEVFSAWTSPRRVNTNTNITVDRDQTARVTSPHQRTEPAEPLG